jgi:hypothetical protein
MEEAPVAWIFCVREYFPTICFNICLSFYLFSIYSISLIFLEKVLGILYIFNVFYTRSFIYIQF